MIEDLLNNQDKKYLPIETSINGFSYFIDSYFALYISNQTLYLLNLLTGKTEEIEVFSEVLNVKCVSQDTFVVADYENVHHVTFIKGDIIIQNTYPIDDGVSKIIDATSNLSIIALSTNKNLIVISEGILTSHNMVDIQYSMTVSQDGKYIASGSEKGIKILDSTSFEITKEIETQGIPISISFAPDGKTLLYGDDSKNIVSLDLDSGKTTNYSNFYYSKPIFFGWLDKGSCFIASFLSNSIAVYNIGNEEGKTIELNEFPSRYFQHASLINEKIIAICEENLRTSSKIESIPTSDIVFLQKIKNDNNG